MLYVLFLAKVYHMALQIFVFYCIRMAESWEKKKEELLRRSPELFENPQKILIVPGLVSEQENSVSVTPACK